MTTTNSLPPLDTLLGPTPPSGLSQISHMRWASKHPPKDPDLSFANKTVLVTGANTGLGFEAALKFARLGATRLFLAVRTPSKGEQAKKRIMKATGCDGAGITVLHLDMNSFHSVGQFVATLQTELESSVLDVAVLNAGIAAPSYVINKKTGWESALQVNTLATAMLAIGLASSNS